MAKQLLEDYYGHVQLTKLDDGKLKEQTGSIGAWEAAIWRIGILNLNGRVYGEELAQRIVAENKILVSYDGHDGDRFGEYGPVKAVCKNPRIENGLLIVEIYVIDKDFNARLAQLHELGVGIGVSSVGYGDVDNDGIVNPHTYEIIRYLDFVMTPSGQVYAEPKKDSGEEEEGAPSSKTPEEASSDALKKVEIYKRVQEHILARRRTC